MKIFISQPMRGKTETQIREERQAIIDRLNEVYSDVEIVDSYKPEFKNRKKLEALGDSIKFLSEADALCLAEKWDTTPGCVAEAVVAELYDIPKIFYAELVVAKQREDLKAIRDEVENRGRDEA